MMARTPIYISMLKHLVKYGDFTIAHFMASKHTVVDRFNAANFLIRCGLIEEDGRKYQLCSNVQNLSEDELCTRATREYQSFVASLQNG